MGHWLTMEAVKRYAAANHPNISFTVMYFDEKKVEQLSAQLSKAESEHDAVLFSGGFMNEIMLDLLTPAIPWDYVWRNERQILTALLKAAHLGYDICRVSFDLPSLIAFPSNIMNQIFARIGVARSNQHHIQIKSNIFDKNIMGNIAKQHEANFRSGKCSFCLTGLSRLTS